MQAPVEPRQRPANRGRGFPRRRRPEGGDPRRRPAGPAGPRARPAQEGEDAPLRAEPVKTTERYSHMNDDGSFTFGYVAEDGSFRYFNTLQPGIISRGKN